MAFKYLLFITTQIFLTIVHSQRNITSSGCSRPPDSECGPGQYLDKCGYCTVCKTFGETCLLTTQCCGSDFMKCHNFNEHALPQCLCIQNYQWDSDAVRCFLPVALPQQLLMISVYCAVGVMIALGILATFVHFLRTKLGICMFRKERRTYEMDLEDAEIQAVLDQPHPPPYTLDDNNPSPRASISTVTADTHIPASRVHVQDIHFSEPPPTYDNTFNRSSLQTSVTRVRSCPLLSEAEIILEPSSFHRKFSTENHHYIPDIIVTPPPSDIVIFGEVIKEESKEENTVPLVKNEDECRVWSKDNKIYDSNTATTSSSTSTTEIADSNERSEQNNTSPACPI